MASKSRAQADINLAANVGISPAATRYQAIFTVAPTDTTLGTECADAGYTRQIFTPGAITYPAGISSVTNTNAIDFPVVVGSAFTVVASALMTTSTPGTGAIIYYDDTVTPQTIPTGQQYRLLVGTGPGTGAIYTED